MDQPDQPLLLADLWLIHDVRSAKLDQLFHIVLDQLSRSAQLSRLNIPFFNVGFNNPFNFISLIL